MPNCLIILMIIIIKKSFKHSSPLHQIKSVGNALFYNSYTSLIITVLCGATLKLILQFVKFCYIIG